MRNAAFGLGLDQAREDIVVDILMKEADFEFERAARLAEGQVD